MDVHNGQETVADHWFQGDEERTDPLGDVDDLDSHG